MLLGILACACEPGVSVSGRSQEIDSSLAPGETVRFSVVYEASGDAGDPSGGEARLRVLRWSPVNDKGFQFFVECEDGQVAEADLSGGELGFDGGWLATDLSHLTLPSTYQCDLDLTANATNSTALDFRWVVSGYLDFARGSDLDLDVSVDAR